MNTRQVFLWALLAVQLLFPVLVYWVVFGVLVSGGLAARRLASRRRYAA